MSTIWVDWTCPHCGRPDNLAPRDAPRLRCDFCGLYTDNSPVQEGTPQEGTPQEGTSQEDTSQKDTVQGDTPQEKNPQKDTPQKDALL
ncbi:hypothetical protein EAF04_005141 [Stromatinia cepivora]|nr:hypothetical protein EAF04_005141 [Stromatinia cepivora]